MPLRLPRPVVCLVTSGAARRADDASANALVALAVRAAEAGVDIVQLRERHLSGTDGLRLARRVIAALDRFPTAVLVNERTDVALASGADGVHLRGDAMRASRVRAIAPPVDSREREPSGAGELGSWRTGELGSWGTGERGKFLIGRSVHSLREAREAEADGGADYLIFGTVFPTASKPEGHTVAGVESLKEVCASVRLPVLAIGGLNVGRLPGVAAAGAAGLAGVGLFVDANHRGASAMSALVREARRAFDTPRDVV
jgi:thiamine-phosphate pyrophosphorylase